MKKGKQHIFAALFLFHFCAWHAQKFAVYFPSDGARLDSKNRAIIDTFFKTGSVVRVSLKAYCDSIGTNDYNAGLSQKRVQAVRKYLLSKHIPDSIIREEALGEISARSSNETADLRAKNRRVDVVISRKKTPGPVAARKPLNVLISGKVLDEDSLPMVAEISVADRMGKEVQKGKSGEDGSYRITATLWPGDQYSITYFNDSSFITTNTVVASVRQATLQIRHIKLKKLKAGEQYPIENLYFIGGAAEVIAASKPTLHALLKLMKRNNGLEIRIEGHVNNPYSVTPGGKTVQRFSGDYRPGFDQWLSDERAKTVYNFLLNRGIAPSRMSSKGFGSSKMLFPNARSEAEMSQNRRVEVFVVKTK